VPKEEEEPPGMPEEEEEPPGVLEEESPGIEEEERCGGLPISPSSRLMKPPSDVREEVRRGGGWSFPPHSMREKEQCGSREK
jgi:hypothetical protein